MRAPKTEATGTSGQSFVKGHFETLGWGVMPNPEHDLGTDMVVQARDEGGFDLGLLLGVQVKSGASYFKEPCEEYGVLVGWWFREDEDHFNYWLEYQAAHIVVLHDQDTGIAYWVQISSDRVITTGKDRKILVPITQTVDSGHQAELVSAAATKAHAPQWDGSAWEKRTDVPDSSKLRYAMVAPRLTAPHSNTQPDDLSADEAIALFVKQRFFDVERWREKQPLLDPNLAAESDAWEWQLYGALQEWGRTGEREKLEALVSSASNAAQDAAIAVCVGHAMFEDGDPVGALRVIVDALSADGLSPADSYWLIAHRARLAYEAGDLEGARDAAKTVKNIDVSLRSDPTVRVLLGSASELLFNLGEWGEESLAEVIRGRDNMVNLWRGQVLGEGLGKQVEESFYSWAPNNSVTFGATDVPWLSYRAVMLLAGYAADSPGWRYGAVLLARRELLARGHKAIPDYVFELLRLSGAEKDIRRTAARLVKSGPVAALISAASQVDLAAATRTSLQASLSLIEVAGDLLPGEVCDRNARFALAVLGETDTTIQRLKPRFFVGEAVLKMLTSLWHGLSPALKEEVKGHILGLPIVEDQLVAGGYGRLLRRIGDDSWSNDELAQLVARPSGDDGDNFELTGAIESLTASRSPEFRTALLGRIAAGEVRALSSYGNVIDLPEDVAQGAITSLAKTVAAKTESARRGAYGMGGPDVLRALVLLNIWHANQADWETCIAALAEEKMMPEHLEGALDLLAAIASHVEQPVKDALRQPLGQIRDRGEFPSALGNSSEGVTVRAAATVVLALLFPETVEAGLLMNLVRGDVGQRNAAARILVAREDEAALLVLAALSKDVDPGVRSTVAEGLGRWVVQGIARDASFELVKELLAEPGTAIGIAVAGTLSFDSNVVGSQLLADLLVDHPSRVVRLHVARELADAAG